MSVYGQIYLRRAARGKKAFNIAWTFRIYFTEIRWLRCTARESVVSRCMGKWYCLIYFPEKKEKCLPFSFGWKWKFILASFSASIVAVNLIRTVVFNWTIWALNSITTAMEIDSITIYLRKDSLPLANKLPLMGNSRTERRLFKIHAANLNETCAKWLANEARVSILRRAGF